MSVINEGTSCNQLTHTSPSGVGGPSALQRVDRDVLSQPGVRVVIDPNRLAVVYDSGDHLYPNTAGYQQMANTVDVASLRSCST